MSLEVVVQGIYPIDDLVYRYPVLKRLKQIMLKRCDEITWRYQEELIYDLQTMFIGKTGYGKSSTINKIVGKQLLETSEIEVCTKKLYSVEYELYQKNEFFSFIDLPGIGESNQKDQQYYEWYRDMLSHSCCVVYILRSDQRDYSLDEVLFKEMFRTPDERKKVILALNFADKVEPVNRKGEITQEQLINLNIKAEAIKKQFDIRNVVYYSAETDFNLNLLVQKIATILLNNTFVI